jgi:hypothetical protein
VVKHLPKQAQGPEFNPQYGRKERRKGGRKGGREGGKKEGRALLEVHSFVFLPF